MLVGELMDEPGLDPSAHRRALRALARLNTLSRADAPIWRAIRAHHARQVHAAPIRLLDVAAGSGDVLLRVCRRAAREGIDMIPVVCDISPEACALAEARAEQLGVRLKTHALDATRDPLPTGFDVACCGLFLHHLTDSDATRVLSAMRHAASNGLVLVSDLARTPLGLSLAAAVPRFTTRSHIVHTDAVRSVRAAWARDELRTLFTNADMPNPSITRVWPERWLATWKGHPDA